MTHSSLTHDLLNNHFRITPESSVIHGLLLVVHKLRVSSRELMSCDAVFPDAQDALLMSWSSSRGLQAEATTTHLSRESR